MKITAVIIGIVILIGTAFFILSKPSIPREPSLPTVKPPFETTNVPVKEPIPEAQPIPEVESVVPTSPETKVQPESVEVESSFSLCQPSRESQEFIVDIYSFADWQPPSLTVCVGDTITFINHDNNLHWPGADPHPTHTSLPQFDALGGISKNQSYSYTFRTDGVYGHHDHLLNDPPTIGIITVSSRE